MGRILTEFEKQQLPFEQKIRLKASALTKELKWGAGATERMVQIVSAALDTPCPYCGKYLVLANISLDHKVPLLRSSYNKYARFSGELRALNNPENLHIICTRCNKIKREIPHEKFVKLLAFLDQDPDLKKQVLDRLSSSGMAFMFSRFKKNLRS